MTQVVGPSELRTRFFDLVFEDHEGFICICTSDPRAPKSRFHQEFFQWPNDSIRMETWISRLNANLNVYFCVNLLSKTARTKANCLPTDVLWADLDTTNPDAQQPEPQIVIESSPGRFQALWKVSLRLDPIVAENYSKRIAYHWGADKSGWDLTQLLRVPGTFNQKYDIPPKIKLIRSLSTKAPPLLFEGLKEVVGTGTDIDEIELEDVPAELPDANNVIYKFTAQLRPTAFNAIYLKEPAEETDWSIDLWRLIHICLEAGMNAEETFVVAASSPVNKYKRDHRPATHLWREVKKAVSGASRLQVISGNFRPLIMPDIVPSNFEPPTDNFLTRYRAWAIEATDAVPAFHDLSATIALSAIVSNSVRLATSYEKSMVPNLWGLVLGDSTLTRKTTAMRMAIMDLLAQVDKETILATDGTAEGLLTGLSTRSHKSSVFFKDEVSGFFESINRREYLAGLPETLTHLYDVPQVYTRMLRKDTIRIESPIFIFFGGGVRDRVYEAISEEYVISGFLPRFLVVGGDTDFGKLRRTGPASDINDAVRAKLEAEIADLKELYATEVMTKVAGQNVPLNPRIIATLTDKAWSTYGDIEELMLRTATDSPIAPLALPTFERMSRSLLKMAVIMGAARQMPKEGKILIEEIDVQTAAYYVQQWGPHSIDLIMNAGKAASERTLDKIIKLVENEPGILRSSIMQQRHLTKRQADEILGTLEDRQLVRKEQQGKGCRYYAN